MPRYAYTTYDGEEFVASARSLAEAARGVERAEYARTESHAAAAFAVDSLCEDADPYRETLAAMSDQAIRHQLVAGAPGGRQRSSIVAEARRRGIQ